MKFGPLQLNYFRADEGAYSIVTGDERRNSQITLTEADGEAAIAIRALGRANIPRRAARGRASNVFVRHPDETGQPAMLIINFPKAAGDELRIYRNASQGFNYEAGDVWFVYRRAAMLFVGAMPEPAWRALGRNDEEDEKYIDLTEQAEAGPVAPARITTLVYARDPAIAVRRFKAAGYCCEVKKTHRLFESRATGRPFVEAHHLVPVSLGKRFPQINLDQLENIFALCPWCHRAIHHGGTALVTSILSTLIGRREALCGRLQLTPEEILRLYNCEAITR